MSTLTIRDLETLSGIKAHTIRMWEQRYQFLKPRRSDTNIRYYCTAELKLLLDIALLNKSGYRISQINSLSVQQIRATAGTLTDQSIVQENIVNEMIGMMVDLDMEKFENLISAYTATKGIERAISDLVYPFLEKSGLLWKTGHLNPASEQLVSNILRQKLIVAIESTAPKELKKKTVLLFLPENDHHEIGLLYIYYLLKSRGFSTIYLGDNVPLDDLEHIVKLKKPDLILTHLIGATPAFKTDKYIQQLRKKIPATKLIISGKLTHAPRVWPENVEWCQSIEQTVNSEQ